MCLFVGKREMISMKCIKAKSWCIILFYLVKISVPFSSYLPRRNRRRFFRNKKKFLCFNLFTLSHQVSYHLTCKCPAPASWKLRFFISAYLFKFRGIIPSFIMNSIMRNRFFSTLEVIFFGQHGLSWKIWNSLFAATSFRCWWLNFDRQDKDCFLPSRRRLMFLFFRVNQLSVCYEYRLCNESLKNASQ